jgi:probable phosphoglycerate mutase
VNHLAALDRLANSYAVMRHGQSKANARGIIVSRIETDAGGDYGLTELGCRQVRNAALASSLPAGTVICSSDFARAAQTADIMRAHLRSPDVVIAEALRERCFGRWEGLAAGNYEAVWAADAAGAGHAADGVEPAPCVLDRVTAFIAGLEREHSGQHILLVAHGDTLQILQAGFARMDPARHRSLPHLGTAEIRQLHLAPR